MARSTSKIKEVRKDVWMPKELAKRIDDYRRSVPGKMPSESKVIRELIEAGLDAKPSESKKQKPAKADK